MKINLIFVLVLGIVGCHDYSIQKSGRFSFLLNQKTGQVSIIESDKVINLPKYDLRKEIKHSISGNFYKLVDFNIETKQIINRLLYKIELKGHKFKIKNEAGAYITKTKDFSWYPEAVKDRIYDAITLQFKDDDGFTLIEQTVLINSNSTKLVDYQDNVTGLMLEGEFAVDPILASRVTSLSYLYNMETIMLYASIKSQNIP
ncbi:hypothetical protein [Photobacterium damselae]|uniref:Lipoprotein n=1 Tax=Photobacterium damselae subsp. damselae TaxID=85581 RepID=A0AAD3WT05_PHODD|nr:hypothetical protein [Photobacterium damselae]KAB1176194.1 hypothetical protein F6450_18355 [Photobacterium damselae subsp. damselae]